MRKMIITAAITGAVHTPSMSPYLPITPKEIADEAVRAHEAGAAVCHIHVRNPETGEPVSDIDLYREVVGSIRSRCNIVICITTGGAIGMPVEQRIGPAAALRPELASLNCGSLNFGLFQTLGKYKAFKFDWEETYLAGTEDFIFPNTFKSIKYFMTIFREKGIKPELEIYDAGMVNTIAFMIDNGIIEKPVYIQFVLGILGGITATSDSFLFLVEYAKKLIGDFEFSVCAAGNAQFAMCTQSLLLGGHARVGLEDNLYLAKGILAKSNADQVEKIIRIARELGRQPASPDDAREILSL